MATISSPEESVVLLQIIMGGFTVTDCICGDMMTDLVFWDAGFRRKGNPPTSFYVALWAVHSSLQTQSTRCPREGYHRVRWDDETDLQDLTCCSLEAKIRKQTWGRSSRTQMNSDYSGTLITCVSEFLRRHSHIENINYSSHLRYVVLIINCFESMFRIIHERVIF